MGTFKLQVTVSHFLHVNYLYFYEIFVTNIVTQTWFQDTQNGKKIKKKPSKEGFRSNATHQTNLVFLPTNIFAHHISVNEQHLFA